MIISVRYFAGYAIRVFSCACQPHDEGARVFRGETPAKEDRIKLSRKPHFLLQQLPDDGLECSRTCIQFLSRARVSLCATHPDVP